MRDLKNVEKILRDARLPDTKNDEVRLKMWQALLGQRRERQRRGLLYRIKPWMWALASIIFILICVLIMIAIAG
jgi:hypothetical protein